MFIQKREFRIIQPCLDEVFDKEVDSPYQARDRENPDVPRADDIHMMVDITQVNRPRLIQYLMDRLAGDETRESRKRHKSLVSSICFDNTDNSIPEKGR